MQPKPVADKNHLIWIDLEMTGLNPDSDVIIEIATIVTDSDLNVLAEGPSLAIQQSQATMDAMDEWNTRQHGHSGLTERVLNSEIDAAEAERQTLAFSSAMGAGGRIADVRQQHLPRPPLFVARHAAVGSVFSLPQFGCQHHQRTGETLATGNCRRREEKQLTSGAG
jgi:hypothetical protein